MDVISLMRRLRAPDGCPWDREQTHASLRRYLMEEAFEALDAIDDGDMDRLADELGDLLLQVVFHAQLASEAGAFDMGDVSARLAAKLIRRHPHVFGEERYAGERHLGRWEELKRQERKEGEEEASILAGVPRAAPALFQAERLLERAARVNVRPPAPAVPARHEERAASDPRASGAGETVAEAARPAGGEAGEDIAARLFALVAEARERGVDPEQALRAANRRFAERFERFEALARLNGRKLETLMEAEAAALWDQAG